MTSTVETLARLSEAVQTVHAGRSGGQRLPDFTAADHSSSRPRSSRGTTFHFSHKTVSKRRDVSEGNTTQTPASAHQGYIERPGAGEPMATDEATDVAIAPLAALVAETPPPFASRLASAEADAQFTRPERVAATRHTGFGTLGDAPRPRRDFWRSMESIERRNARIQNRIIAELPHELTRKDHLRVALDFCQVFEERDIPYWAAIHTPTAANDPRNVHLHIAYADRPARRSASGAWDFEITEVHKKRSRTRVTRRPFRRAKHPDTRARSWIKSLRRLYADTCNFYLSLAGHDRRLDPRRYEESGVEKEPTEHVGSKSSALEAQGLDTVRGTRNAKREIRWRFTRSERPWMSRVADITRRFDAGEDLSETDEAMLSIARAGITAARRKTANEVSADLLERRFTRRFTHLSQASAHKGPVDPAERNAAQTEADLDERLELSLLGRHDGDVRRAAAKCRAKAADAAHAEALALENFDRLRARHMDDPFDEIASQSPAPPGQADPFEDADWSALRRALDEIAPDNRSGPEKSPPSQGGDAEIDPFEELQGRQLVDAQTLDELSSARTETTNHTPPADHLHPEALALPLPRDDEELSRLDDYLRALDNTDLRHAAIATRDALDLDTQPEARGDLARGYAVLELESRRRGLDLETGRHDPARAEDPQRARLHRDEATCHVRVIRKNLDRQRVRE